LKSVAPLLKLSKNQKKKHKGHLISDPGLINKIVKELGPLDSKEEKKEMCTSEVNSEVRTDIREI
jgi:hypothetical protein